LQVLSPAPGQTRVAYFTIIHLEQHQASDLNWYSFKKIIISILIEKLCKQVLTKLKSEPKLFKFGAGAGAETVSAPQPCRKRGGLCIKICFDVEISLSANGTVRSTYPQKYKEKRQIIAV
jgi:hypothetical protein